MQDLRSAYLRFSPFDCQKLCFMDETWWNRVCTQQKVGCLSTPLCFILGKCCVPSDASWHLIASAKNPVYIWNFYDGKHLIKFCCQHHKLQLIYHHYKECNIFCNSSQPLTAWQWPKWWSKDSMAPIMDKYQSLTMSIVIVLGCSKDYYNIAYPKHTWNTVHPCISTYIHCPSLFQTKPRLAVFCAWLRGTSLYPDNFPKASPASPAVWISYAFTPENLWDELASLPGWTSSTVAKSLHKKNPVGLKEVGTCCLA